MRFGSKQLVPLVLVAFSVWLIGCGAADAPTPTQARIATTSAVPVATPTTLPPLTPTAAPSPTNTATPTSAPTMTLTPTRLPIPTLALPPGWKKIESAQIELAVADSFVGGDPIKEKDAIHKTLRAWGSEYVGLIKWLEQNPTAFALYAIDSKMGSSGFVTTVSVTVNQIVSTSAGDTLQGGVKQQLREKYTALDRRNVILGYYAAERMVTDSATSSARMRQLVYTVKSLNTAWVVAYSTSESEFFARLPAFEQSIQTLRFKP
jgi:hypothetical protein